MKLLFTSIFLIFNLLVCKSQINKVTINGLINNYNSDSIHVYFFDKTNFEPSFPNQTILISKGEFHLTFTTGAPKRVAFSIDKFFISGVLVKAGMFNVELSYIEKSNVFNLKVLGMNYPANSLDSIDLITYSPPHKFQPYKLYPQFIQLLDRFTRLNISTDSLIANTNNFIENFGKKYFDQYDQKQIQKWFFDYRIKELKSNLLYELMENTFGLNLTAPQYESDLETKLLKKIHNTYKYHDSLKVWNNFSKYAIVEGLADYAYIKYRFLSEQSLLNRWYMDPILNNVIVYPTKNIKNSKFPIVFEIDSNIFELRLSEIIMNKIMAGNKINNKTISLVKTNYGNSKALNNALVLKARTNFLSTKKLSYQIAFVKPNEDFLKLIKRVSDGKVLLIDLWAYWCAPCKDEFANESPTLDTFLNINKVKRLYIAMGNAKSESLIKVNSNIKHYKLNGTHIMANKELENEIYQVVYKNEEMHPIPRYLITDKNGNIINYNSPRPSLNSSKELMNELKEALKVL